MVSQAESLYGEAQAAGEARMVLEQYLVGVPRWDVNGRIATAGMLEGRLAGFGAATALAPETAAELHDLSFNGRQMGGARRKEMEDEHLDTLRDEIVATAEVLGMGNPNVSDEMELALTNALYALGWEMKDSGESVEDEFNAFLTPYLNTVELDNGTFVPRSMASPGEVNAINKKLGELLERTTDPVLYESLVPHPLPEGQWAFRSRRSGQLIPDLEDDSKPFVVDARPAIEKFAEDQLQDDAGFFSAATGGRTPVQQMLEVDIPEAARRTEGDTGLLQAVFLAGQVTPGEEKLDQEYSMLWSRSNKGVVDEARYKAAYRAAARDTASVGPGNVNPLAGGGTSQRVPDPLRDPLGATIYASLLLDDLFDKYGDPRKALAAYYVGDAELDAAVTEAGDAWESEFTDDVSQFISRVQGRLDAR